VDASERPPSAPAARLPVNGADGTQFIEIDDVRSIKADAHYTLIHDGSRERPCPWSISEAEARLDPTEFVRAHRSYIVSIPHVVLIRKEGDGAVVELAGPSRHLVPVSRAKLAELKARLGLSRRSTPAIHTAQPSSRPPFVRGYGVSCEIGRFVIRFHAPPCAGWVFGSACRQNYEERSRGHDTRTFRVSPAGHDCRRGQAARRSRR
jgi:hypothetical protein